MTGSSSCTLVIKAWQFSHSKPVLDTIPGFIVKGRVYFHIWECRARGFFIIIFGRRFAGEKHYPKRPTATPTMRLPVAVKCGWGIS